MMTNYDHDGNHILVVTPILEHIEDYDRDGDHGMAMTTNYVCDNYHGLAMKFSAALDLLFASSNKDKGRDCDHGCDDGHDIPMISYVKSFIVEK